MTGMLIYSVLIILHYYCIIIFYYDDIILSYYYIILAQYIIYWHFFNQGFCSRMAPYQWFWIIEDCFRHRILARIFSMLKKTTKSSKSLCFFWGPGSLGPGPMVPPGAHGAQLGGWGKLPTVRQSYLLSHMHPTTAYMHPTEP